MISRNRARKCCAANHKSPIIVHKSERGVALIITLIMLAVITFMATTFLVLSRRERNAVTTNTDQTIARFTADTAFERAKTELLGRILSATNDQNFDLMVPTNYFNPLGFNTTLGIYNATNVNYDYTIGGGAVSGNNALQNLENLLYDPRPPVFVTNREAKTTDFRFYLDLNRNGRFEQTGLVPETNSLNLPTGFTNGYVGDPHWIGVLRFPERPHSPDNPFVARWTYFVTPADKTLDVNYLHNQTQNRTLSANDGFFRNQGVGPWEINLAAFFADLNTNIWDADNGLSANYYQYNQAGTPPNRGIAFDDARALLSYRYNYSYGNLAPANSLFANSALPFETDGIDQYSDGLLQFGTRLPVDNDATAIGNSTPWAGADNPNHFFTLQDLYDQGKTSAAFYSRLLNLGTSNAFYDRYTFYRLAAQLGTDSQPDRKININYLNVDTNGNVIPGMETNLISWSDPRIGTVGGIPGVVPPNAPPGPLLFFQTAASRMFEHLDVREAGIPNGKLITITNIPVYPTNYYTPLVHRVLQLAANMFEATTNTIYPSIYRPLFTADTLKSNVWISGFELVNGPDNKPTPSGFLTFPIDITDPSASQRGSIGTIPTALNVYGFPWVIGARKGLPNLNKLAVQNFCQLTRKIQISRPYTQSPIGSYNGYHWKAMMICGISNTVAAEFWNSYQTAYPRNTYVQVDGVINASVTNDLGYNSGPMKFLLGPGASASTNIPANLWRGTGIVLGGLGDEQRPATASFVVPLLTNIAILPDSYALGTQLIRVGTNTDADVFWNTIPFENATPTNWGVMFTNNFRCMVFDGGSSGRIIDYVQISPTPSARSLGEEARNADTKLHMWLTNYASGPNLWMPANSTLESIVRQIYISNGTIETSDTDWSESGLPTGTQKQNAIDGFNQFLDSPTVSSNRAQTPYCPSSKIAVTTSWEANDPLVHYLPEDLGETNQVRTVRPPNGMAELLYTNLWRLNDRYSPWGGNPLTKGSDPASYDTARKDPLVRTSDEWDFPTNKFPNIGWLGRVHRGTPWQTVYLKSADVIREDRAGWMNWSGARTVPIATNNAPINDRQLFDIFTATLNDNSTRGHLSINQTNLAAWSAVLSGVIVLTNGPADVTNGAVVIEPAGVYDPFNTNSWPAVVQIVNGINATRANLITTNGIIFPGQSFQSLGDILSVPQLSDASPFLITNYVDAGGTDMGLHSDTAGGITDEVMERIPQQIMGLLTLSHSPRFVVYSYGQTLRPAPQSVVLGGDFSGLCTNYQVTAETATRAVVRVEGSPDPRYGADTNGIVHPDRFGNTYPPRIAVEQFNILPPD